MQYNFLFSEDGDNEVILRFEDMLRTHAIGYFDVEDFELIVEHYTAILEFNKALIVIEEALNQHPMSSSILVLKSRVFFKLGKYKTAMSILRSIPGIEFDVEALMLEGELHMRLGKLKLADSCFSRMLDISIDEKDQCCLDIAYVYMGAGEKKMAYRYLNKGLEFNPGNKEILFELALDKEEKGETVVAIAYYNRLLDIDPYNEDAWFSLAMAYSNQENYQKCLEALDYTLAIDETFTSAYMHKGNTLMRLDRYREAIEVFDEYGKHDNNKSESLVFKAECYEELKEFETAIQLYKEALEHDEVLEAYIGMGFCTQSLKQFELSNTCFLKALELKEDDDEVWAGLAENYIAVEDYKKALNALNRSLLINPEQIDLWVHTAGIYIFKDNITKGLEAIKNGLLREPSSKELLVLFSYCLVLTGQVDQAKKILDFELTNELISDFAERYPELDLFQVLEKLNGA